MYPSTSGRPPQRPQTISSMSPWPAHWTGTTYEPLEPKTILPRGSFPRGNFPRMLPRAPPIQQDPDKLRVSLKPTALPRSSDGPTIHPINHQARPLGAVLTSSHPLLPTAVSPPVPSLTPGALTLSTSSPPPPSPVQPCRLLPGLLVSNLSLQSVPYVAPERSLYPELTSSAHSPLWLPSALGQGPTPSVQHSRPCVIWSCPRPLGCFTAALAWLDRDS